MKRYFDIHNQKVTAQIVVGAGPPEATTDVSEFKVHFKSEDVRELIVSQYRRMTARYTG